MLVDSVIETEYVDLLSHHLVLVTSLLLRIYYLLLLYPLVLLLLTTPLLLLHCYHRLGLELVLLRSQNLLVDNRGRRIQARLLLLVLLEPHPGDVALEDSLHDTVLGDIPEGVAHDIVIDHPPFFFRVVVGAGTLPASL